MLAYSMQLTITTFTWYWTLRFNSILGQIFAHPEKVDLFSIQLILVRHCFSCRLSLLCHQYYWNTIFLWTKFSQCSLYLIGQLLDSQSSIDPPTPPPIPPFQSCDPTCFRSKTNFLSSKKNKKVDILRTVLVSDDLFPSFFCNSYRWCF